MRSSLMKKMAAGLATSYFALEYLKKAQFRRSCREQFGGKLVLITGGTRGLGLILAKGFLRSGSHVIICARDDNELNHAVNRLKIRGSSITGISCDLSDKDQIIKMMSEINRRFGQIDILVNNAGLIQVAPLDDLSEQQFKDALDLMFWGVFHPTLQVLPNMLAREEGRIINITSVGGYLSVPHLLPYCSAKFAVVGFSQGLYAELIERNIKVTTVVPSTMRTGSHVNALYGGQKEKEYAWFSLSATLPLISTSAERAAHQILKSVLKNQAVVKIGLPAKIAIPFNALFPNLSLSLMALVNRMLPHSEDRQQHYLHGYEVEKRGKLKKLDDYNILGKSAVRRYQSS